MARPKAPCGTDAAYRRHLRNGEPVDDACRAAHASAGRDSRRSPASGVVFAAVPPSENPDAAAAAPDDMTLIVDTLRDAFKSIAQEDPTKLAPIAREFRAAVEATQAPAAATKELSLADQLAEARAARAARKNSSAKPHRFVAR